ncbi:dimethylmenaquinone methyltransferase [Acrocarpospora pleiomorpha]|uniref:Dimethylmenaquinone methyltransferase n=1 Tax=Acrocarpospora pleiomorpha TaxID=90975 RepID=A0A5M3XH61_9ACTN|nr:FAD-binding and (Fe-S)-binding domain-containing protein [Acrocarpospora pleiomorpha]GES20340.1 dimethylmenaquinone methyltransferase [Acrocarpospora pleiomorpha]
MAMLFERLERDLRARVAGEVRFDTASRAMYATDASNYRQVPIGVVVPRSVADAVAAVTVCREHDVPLLSRGGGTSLAGQCCNAAVVIDWSKYCDTVGSVNEQDHTVVVEPGIVLDQLNARTREHGLIFGPKPATHTHCTLGGMLGNDSCGSTAQAYGKTSDNVADLEVLTYDGRRFWTSRPPPGLARELSTLTDRHADEIRRRFPDIPRRVSGYGLDALLPENGFDLTRALVGSESTLVTILRARLKLIPEPPGRCLAVIPFPTVFDAADAAAEVGRYQPIALEGIDDRLVDFERVKHLNEDFLRLLPDGGGWLIVRFGAESDEAADAQARRMAAELGLQATFFDDRRQAEEVWAIRESGLGATAWVPMAPDAWPGWEDSAVPPDQLGPYLRDLRDLQHEHGYTASLYGHFGHGCVHTRIPFDLTSKAGLDTYRSFVEQAADLVVSYGGSLSGEHGDGLARGELWPRMFGPDLMAAFAEFKALFDPRGRMSPGRLIPADRLDDHLRLGTDYRPPDPPTVFAYPQDENSFARTALRCVGVGECRREEGGVMCPSYRVTREEKHSTRGRARLLFEMLRGDVVTGGWRSPEVRDALDLCLACKGCKSDCPVEVDMATYKAEFLSHHYRGRLRPMAHYSMGWLPIWARLASLLPGLANRLAASRPLKRLAGIAAERPAPAFAKARFSDSYARRGPAGDGYRGEVVLWPDTFTDNFHPAVAVAAVRVLERAGFTVRLPRAPLCCGLTWISTGQLHTAKRVIQRTVRVLREEIRAGLPVVALEPSCTAVLRADAAELFPHDLDMARLRAQTVTLAELLDRHGVRPPRLDRPVLLQPHCHQHAVLGADADARLLRAAGAELTVLDAGCCGLAGNFGFERGHFALSMACAEYALLPALRQAPDEALILADGFSCRTQIEHAGIGRQALHLAEALKAAWRDALPAAFPERAARRPAPARRAKTPAARELRTQAMEAGGASARPPERVGAGHR